MGFHELKAICDPMKKEIIVIRKKLDTVNKEFKSLGPTCQRKERKYKEALDAFNEKNKEKVQLITKLMEVFEESEQLRFKKLDELSKSVEPEIKQAHGDTAFAGRFQIVEYKNISFNVLDVGGQDKSHGRWVNSLALSACMSFLLELSITLGNSVHLPKK